MSEEICSKCGHSKNNHGNRGNTKGVCMVPNCNCGYEKLEKKPMSDNDVDELLEKQFKKIVKCECHKNKDSLLKC